MKKLFLLVAVISIALTGCGKIEDAIDKLENRLDNLEQEKITTIDEQISAINTTLGTLDAMDKELKGYIDGLQVTADNLQKQINDTNTKIDEVKVALQGEIATAKADVLAQLEAAKKELEKELETINNAITTLQEEREKLDGKIEDLRTYVDTELGETTDWVEATFATLEQYNSLVTEIAVIKEQIKATNQSIAALETYLTTKINADIAAAVASLSADIQQKVKDITDGYTDAVKTAKEDITAAYTAAIQTAISNLDSSIKTWVGEQLSNYYTIAEVDAKITALQTTITDGDSALQKQLDELKSQLTTTKQEITEAYKTAIKEAIETNNGVINAQIASEIAIVNQRIESEVTTINAKIVAIEARLDNVEAQVKDLLARIQSVTYVPKYSDGKADLDYETKTVELDYQVSPKSAISELSKVWESALKAKTSYAATRAVTYENTPIISYSADEENATITVTVSLENLDYDFFDGKKEASMALQITDGNNFINSDYTVVYDRNIYEIRYTTSNERMITPTLTNMTVLSHTYNDGVGIIQYSAPIYKISNQAYEGELTLKSIHLPHTITTIESSAFNSCRNLTSITIPNSVTSIGDGAFYYCTSLTSVTIGNSVTKIGSHAFHDCSSLTSVTIPDSVTSIGNSAFYNCTSLTSVTIPDSVTSLGEGAFYNCTSLKEVYCKPTTPPEGSSYMFDSRVSELKIYVPADSINAYKTALFWSDYAASITTPGATVEPTPDPTPEPEPEPEPEPTPTPTPGDGTATTVTVTFNQMGYTNAQPVDGTNIAIDSVISLVFNKATASTAPAYYDASQGIRMYQNGTTLDVTANGKTITSIEFVFDYSLWYLDCDSGVLSAEDDTRTWTGEASAVKFTATGTDKNHRAYIKAMTISYK